MSTIRYYKSINCVCRCCRIDGFWWVPKDFDIMNVHTYTLLSNWIN